MIYNKPVHNVGYHFIWCPKYRRSVLEGDICIRLRQLIYEKASQIGVEVVQLEIMPNHVHAFIKSTTKIDPHYIMTNLKGYTSRVLRSEFKEIRSRIPTLWTRSYYCESVGSLTQEAIEKYIQNQKNV